MRASCRIPVKIFTWRQIEIFFPAHWGRLDYYIYCRFPSSLSLTMVFETWRGTGYPHNPMMSGRERMRQEVLPGPGRTFT